DASLTRCAVVSPRADLRVALLMLDQGRDQVTDCATSHAVLPSEWTAEATSAILAAWWRRSSSMRSWRCLKGHSCPGSAKNPSDWVMRSSDCTKAPSGSFPDLGRIVTFGVMRG